MRYAPGEDDLVCPHCGHAQAIPPPSRHERAEALGELDYHFAIRNALPETAMEETRVLSCPGCGAQVEFTPNTHAAECPFCATPVVTDTGTHRHIKPAALVPFQLEEREAREAMVRWLGRLWFAPNGLQDYARKGRALAGLYVPYWTFDADTASRYDGERGDYYYETRTVTRRENGRDVTREERVRKTRWQRVSGRVSRAFDDVLVMASTGLPRDKADGLAPWDLTVLQPYRPDYLAGFRAEGYTLALDAGHDLARAHMDRVISDDVRRDIGGDEQRIGRIATDVDNEGFKHILLPVWMAAYRYRGRAFRFVVNGQTGKVQGERPWSAWKIAFAVVLALLAAAAVAYVAQNQQP
ncbi:MAG: primosomal protein N' (replication factor Y) - superfamily II helicase [Paracoccaceae bacterium]